MYLIVHPITGVVTGREGPPSLDDLPGQMTVLHRLLALNAKILRPSVTRYTTHWTKGRWVGVRGGGLNTRERGWGWTRVMPTNGHQSVTRGEGVGGCVRQEKWWQGQERY